MLEFDTINGFSREAQEVAEADYEEVQRTWNSEVLGMGVTRRQLNRVWANCSQPDWDGHSSVPVKAETLNHVARLLQSLPRLFPLPTIGADPDGHVTLEWFHSPSRLVSISVTPDAQLHYAGLFGGNTAYGTEPFFGELPESILTMIRRVGINDRF